MSDLPTNEVYTTTDGGAVQAAVDRTQVEAAAALPREIEVETVQTDAELAAETLAALDVCRKSGQLAIPVVTPGDLPLLETFCPAALDGRDYRLADVLTALFVLYCGGTDLDGAYEAAEAIDAVERNPALAVQTAEHYREYLRTAVEVGQETAKFRAAVARFGRQLPAFDFRAVMDTIRTQVGEGTFGFQMVETNGRAEKKTAGASTRNGSDG